MKMLKHVKMNLSAFMDGHVHPKKRKEIEAHLKECSECQEYYQQFLNIQLHMKNRTPFPVSPFFVRKVLDAYEQERKMSIWAALDSIPRFIVRVAFLMSILLLFFTFNPLSNTDNQAENGLSDSYYFIQEEELINESLSTDNQTLSFIISSTTTLNNGGL